MAVPAPYTRGKDAGSHCVGSCLRRNDGGGAGAAVGCRSDGEGAGAAEGVREAGTGLGAGLGEIPAASAGMTDLFCAGMTEVGRWCRVVGVKRATDSLTAAHHARRVAAALARSGGGGA